MAYFSQSADPVGGQEPAPRPFLHACRLKGFFSAERLCFHPLPGHRGELTGNYDTPAEAPAADTS